MAKYFSVKKNTNKTLTVSKTGYTTYTEVINISADTTKNITLQTEGLDTYKFTSNDSTLYVTGEYSTNAIISMGPVVISAITGTLGSSGSTVASDATYVYTYFGVETIGGTQVYLYRRVSSFMSATTYDWAYVLPSSVVNNIMLYHILTTSENTRPKLVSINSTSCSWNGATWTRDQSYSKKWTKSGIN